MSESNPKELFPRQLTEKDASILTGMSVAWFQRKRWEGSGPTYIKIGRSVRYPENELKAWVESQPRVESDGEAV